jgi:hypothetical protein
MAGVIALSVLPHSGNTPLKAGKHFSDGGGVSNKSCVTSQGMGVANNNTQPLLTTVGEKGLCCIHAVCVHPLMLIP